MTETPSAPRPASRLALVAMGIVALVFLLELLVVGGRPDGVSTVNTRLGEPQNRAEQLIWGMDGKAFFQIGEDPTFQHAAASYGGSAGHGVYRSARPVLGWLAWAGAGGGQRPALGWSLLAVSVLSVGALVLALAAVARSIGGTESRILACIAAPGLLAALAYPGLCEPLALAFAFYGLAQWIDGDRRLAVALFCAAALTRETTLLIPLAIGLEHMVRTRRLRGAAILLIPPAFYAAWVAVVRWRVGALPTGSAQFGLPFAGVIETAGSWGPMEWVTAAATIVATVAMFRSGNRIFQWIAGLHLLGAVCLSPLVLSDWWAFGRITLPVCLLALVVPTTGADPTELSDAPAEDDALTAV